MGFDQSPTVPVCRLRTRVGKGARPNEDPLDEPPDHPNPTPPGSVTWIAFAIIIGLILMVLMSLSLSQGENPTPTTTAGPAAAITP